ncbi:MAG: hypothetical protein D6770_08660, partial [Anaerolineae bacterium]
MTAASAPGTGTEHPATGKKVALPGHLRLPLRTPAFLLLLASALSVGCYVAAAALLYRPGYPLDDAWIHQTYARNLAWHGEWAFIPGKPSGGSTAPLWSALLAIGYLLHIPHLLWTLTLGSVLLWGIALIGENTARQWLPSYEGRVPWVGLFLIGEWHLAWAAGSGMETTLYTFLVMLTLSLLASERESGIPLGMLIGVSTWVRPDGVTLLGPAALTLGVRAGSLRERFGRLVRLGMGFGSLFAPYLVFNLTFAGTPWPNTFYAKQVEYAVLRSVPLWRRLLAEAGMPLVGAGALLLPGLALSLWTAARRRWVGFMAGLLWVAGYLGLYAWRLPVTYQHGRYVIPAMPFYFLAGLMGMMEFLLTARGKQRSSLSWHALIGKVWALSLALVWLAFWALGAKAYAQDVAVIESEMVATARWVAQNLPPEALIAAHDIGALGYFGEHDLV